MNTPLTDELVTVRDWLRWATSRFNDAGLFFGHGTDNAWDEAVWLVLGALKLPPEHLNAFLDARLTKAERLSIVNLLQQRIAHRTPTAYLLREAWLSGYRFYVDERVIIPRSYFAELLQNGFAPWIEDTDKVHNALDLCTGSGCLAILMAHAFPHAKVDAVDLSLDALAVARRNIEDYNLDARVHAVASDLFSGVKHKHYDLIISNPPYVTGEAMAALPAEYRHEPALALAAGDDGLYVVRRILNAARSHLNPGGVIAIEVGHNRDLVEAAFPKLPMTWLDSEHAEGKVFLVAKEDLPHKH